MGTEMVPETPAIFKLTHSEPEDTNYGEMEEITY
jgi:hypothetical protein